MTSRVILFGTRHFRILQKHVRIAQNHETKDRQKLIRSGPKVRARDHVINEGFRCDGMRDHTQAGDELHFVYSSC